MGFFKNPTKIQKALNEQWWTCGEKRDRVEEKYPVEAFVAEEEDEGDCWELLVFFAMFLRFGPFGVGRGIGSGEWVGVGSGQAQWRLMIRPWRALWEDHDVLVGTVGDVTA